MNDNFDLNYGKKPSLAWALWPKQAWIRVEELAY
jgi:ketosteroid isomerase-like protein